MEIVLARQPRLVEALDVVFVLVVVPLRAAAGEFAVLSSLERRSFVAPVLQGVHGDRDERRTHTGPHAAAGE